MEHYTQSQRTSPPRSQRRGPAARAAILAFLALAASLSGVAWAKAPPGQGSNGPAAIATSTASSDVVEATVSVDPAAASLSDLLAMTITIRSSEGVEVIDEPFGDRWGDFRIRDVEEKLPTVDGAWTTRTRVYTLEPMRTGELEVWPIPITYRAVDASGVAHETTLQTDPLLITVGTVVENADEGLAALQPMSDPVRLPYPGPPPWVWALGGVVLLSGVGAAAWMFLRGKRRAPEHVPTPRERALAELDDLLDSGLAKRDVKLFYVGITGIVRRYIESTTSILAAEQTTEEFLREIAKRACFNEDEKLRLGRFLESADLVKFAAHRPTSDDLDNSIDRAKDFIGSDLADGPESNGGLDRATDHPNTQLEEEAVR